MIRIMHYCVDGSVHTDVPVESLPDLLRGLEGFLWVDLLEEPHDSSKQILAEVFKFHPLAVEDALDENHFPKADDWDSYMYLDVHQPVAVVDPNGDMPTLELDVFLGAQYLVTYQCRAIQTVSSVWKSLTTDPRPCRRGAAHVLYDLMERLAGDAMRTIEVLDEEIELVEDSVIAHPAADQVERIIAMKRQLLGLRRIFAPEREVISRLARGDFPVIPQDEQVYFRDIYDHLVRLYDITESMRDMLAGALEIYLSVVNNRMNDVMKTLTVITTLFMPLTFLAGFFGMNYFGPSEALPLWTGHLSLILTLCLMVIVPAVMLAIMRRRSWM